jgi:diguanylate cyclase (GGDEF)-like protein/PAS domain S-box-containing protein
MKTILYKKNYQRKTDYKFSDLVDVEDFKKLLDSYYKATGIPNGLVDNDGTIISQSGWIDACTKFHRGNPETKHFCQESNLCLMEKLKDNEVSEEKCKNGLFDYATPIEIDGKRLATLFLGQVLNEKPDINFFTKQAQKYDYDKIKYLKAIDEVQIVSKEKIESIMDSMVLMAQMLVKIGLSKLNENRLEEKLSETKEQSIQLKDILDFSPVGIAWSTADGKVEYVNHQFTKLFGYTVEDIPNLETWYKKAYTNLKYKEEIISPWLKKVANAQKSGEQLSSIEANITCKDGTQKRVYIRVSWVGEKRLVSFNDITDHWKSELRNRAHDTMLEMVAKNNSLHKILYEIVLTIEKEDPNSICSVLLLDKEGKHLITGAAPNLPESYNEAIDGVEIGEGVGSCGTAAYLAKRIIVEDINTHKYWKPYKHLALNVGLQACWSEPILSSEGKVLGTFAIYHKEPATPTSSDIERITFAANLTSIAIENRSARDELEKRAYYDYLTNIPNRRYFIERAEDELERNGDNLSLIMFDIDYFKRINDSFGHKTGDIVLQEVAHCSKDILRKNDIIGRIGGEEFAIVLPNANIQKATKIAERLRIAINQLDIKVNDTTLPKISASFGVIENKNQNIDELLIQADAALYEAKNSGRNKVVSASYSEY